MQTESATVQQLVTRSQIDHLELNGRNPLYHGLVPARRHQQFDSRRLQLCARPGSYEINGSRQTDLLLTFDGAPAIRTRGNNSSIGVADVDSTQEMQILTADFAAEYGRSAGGQIRFITKSGGRDFHGSAYEYFRNSELNANTWTRNQSTTTNFTSPFRFNQFGFTVGGPVYIPHKSNQDRQKWFFFVGEEWLRYRFTDTTTGTVPTALMRQGNFSELLGPNNFYNKPTIIYDPRTCATAGNAACQPFTGNIIPTSRLSPNGIGILSAYPSPTAGYQSGSQNWIGRGASDQPAQGHMVLRLPAGPQRPHLVSPH